MRQTLVYANDNLYTYGCLCLMYQDFTEVSNNYVEENLQEVLNKFTRKRYSELHIIQLDLDPINEISEVIRNDYFQNPLKEKTIINPKAAPSKLLIKTLTSASLT